MKKITTIIGALGLTAFVSSSAVSCGQQKDNAEVTDNTDVIKKFRENVNSYFYSAYSKTQSKLTEFKNDPNEIFPYLKKMTTELADFYSKESSKNTRGINVGEFIDANEIDNEILSPFGKKNDPNDNGNYIFNKEDLKTYINSTITQLDFNVLSYNNGQVFDNIGVEKNSCTLKYNKFKDEYKSLSLTFNIKLSWSYNDNGSIAFNNIVMQITYLLIGQQDVATAIQHIQQNLSKVAYNNGTIRFISKIPDENANKFDVIEYDPNSNTPARNLASVYDKHNLKSALQKYISSSTKFDSSIKESFELIKNGGLSEYSLNTTDISLGDDSYWNAPFTTNGEYLIPKISDNKSSAEYPGISYKDPLWSVFNHRITNEKDAKKILNDTLSNKNMLTYSNENYESDFHDWSDSLGLEPKYSINSSLAYGNMVITGIKVTYNNTVYDLETAIIMYDYSNRVVSKLEENKTSRTYYFTDLFYKEITVMGRVIGVVNTGETNLDSVGVITITNESSTGRGASSLLGKNGDFSFLNNSNCEKIASEIGLEANSVSDNILMDDKKSVVYSGYKIDEPDGTKAYIFGLHYSKDTNYRLTWSFNFGPTKFTFDFTEYFKNRFGKEYDNCLVKVKEVQ